LSLDEIERLYAARGGLTYGEDVTQMEHALQCAALAETSGAAPGLIAAALLHDIGHLLMEEPAAATTDDRHEIVGAQALKGAFDLSVRAPIALHVSAKRYLCFTEPGYFDALSAASKASLALQGGSFDAEQAVAFERQAFWRDAIALRRFDEGGKAEDAAHRSIADYRPLLQTLCLFDRSAN
jgi:phosphonate degradation associated HDIG domain protein